MIYSHKSSFNIKDSDDLSEQTSTTKLYYIIPHFVKIYINIYPPQWRKKFMKLISYSFSYVWGFNEAFRDFWFMYELKREQLIWQGEKKGRKGKKNSRKIQTSIAHLGN